MILFISATMGAIFGTLTAKKRGGNALDMAQYAAGFAIAFAIIGLFVTLMIVNAEN